MLSNFAPYKLLKSCSRILLSNFPLSFQMPYFLFRFRQKAGHESGDGIIVLTMFIYLFTQIYTSYIFT